MKEHYNSFQYNFDATKLRSQVARLVDVDCSVNGISIAGNMIFAVTQTTYLQYNWKTKAIQRAC